MIGPKQKLSKKNKHGVNTRGFQKVGAMPNPATETPGHEGGVPYVKFPPRKKNRGKHMDEGQFSNPIP